MIKSMTGYGRCSESIDGFDITFELKSVNNRYLDTNIRLPRAYGYLEEKIKKLISANVSRGKVDAFLSIEHFGESDEEIVIDEGLIEQYITLIGAISKKYSVPSGIDATTISKFPDVFKKKSADEAEDVMWERCKGVIQKAIDSFTEMRKAEGKNLYDDLSGRLDTLEKLRSNIASLADTAIAEYKDRLETKIKEYIGEFNIDEGRILTEVGIMADKIDTGEEVTRLKSHIDQFKNLLKKDTPAGRNLDFLTQELNREVNTIGSKCSLIEITNYVIEAKNEIERIREQIQNIE